MENQQNYPKHSRDLVFDRSVDLEALHTEYIAAFHDWVALYQDPECLTDINKYQVMTQARLRYQDAKLHYFYVKRLIATKFIGQTAALTES